MRKLLIALGSITFLTVAGFALVWLLVDVNQFRPAIQADLQKQLHRPVTLGEMSLGLFPLVIRVDNVSVGENPQFATGRPFVTETDSYPRGVAALCCANRCTSIPLY